MQEKVIAELAQNLTSLPPEMRAKGNFPKKKTESLNSYIGTSNVLRFNNNIEQLEKNKIKITLHVNVLEKQYSFI
jgi:hypothetical protein